MRHAQGSDTHQRFFGFVLVWRLVKSQVFPVPSVGTIARCVQYTRTDPNPLVVSLLRNTIHPRYTWQHTTTDATGWEVVTSCGGVQWNRLAWYWTGSWYPGIQFRVLAQTAADKQPKTQTW